jgi:hypothetical protein
VQTVLRRGNAQENGFVGATEKRGAERLLSHPSPETGRVCAGAIFRWDPDYADAGEASSIPAATARSRGQLSPTSAATSES